MTTLSGLSAPTIPLKQKAAIRHYPIVEQVELQPNETVKVPVGLYPQEMREPSFYMECSPECETGNEIEVSYRRDNTDEEYTLTYTLKNGSDQARIVTIRKEIDLSRER